MPRSLVPDGGVEDDEELSHAGGERELLRLAGGEEAAIEASDHEIEARGDQSGHVKAGAKGSAPAPDRALAAQGTAVAIEGSNADESRDLLAAEASQFRPITASSKGCVSNAMPKTKPRDAMSRGMSKLFGSEYLKARKA